MQKITTAPNSLDIPLVAAALIEPMSEKRQQQQTIAEDPNRRHLEEVLVARISNDLGSEYMAGLFGILKGRDGQSVLDEDKDEDEDMELDLSSLV